MGSLGGSQATDTPFPSIPYTFAEKSPGREVSIDPAQGVLVVPVQPAKVGVEAPRLETQFPRQRFPAEATLLQIDFAVFQGHEKLGLTIGIEGVLDGHLEAVENHAIELGVGRVIAVASSSVPGHADFRIEGLKGALSTAGAALWSRRNRDRSVWYRGWVPDLQPGQPRL